MDLAGPPGPMACLALALGLAAEDGTLRRHAQEGLMAVLAAGSFPAETLGATVARLLGTGHNKLTRWSKSFGEVARISRNHARQVADVLQRAFHSDPACAPRDVHQLIELLLELLCELDAPLADPKAAGFLRKLSAGGKTARLARQLLARAETR